MKEANLPAPFLAHAANQASVTLSTLPAGPGEEEWPEQKSGGESAGRAWNSVRWPAGMGLCPEGQLDAPNAPLRGFILEKKPGRQVGMGKCREGSEFSTVASREGFMPGSPTWANRGAPSGLHFREKKN